MSTGPGATGADELPAPVDAALLGSVRRRLVLWSAGSTLAVLVVLGAVLYLAVAGSLDAAARRPLAERAERIATFVQEIPAAAFELPTGGPQVGFAFGGPGSGTLAVIVAPDGTVVGSRGLEVPGIPIADGVAAARAGAPDYRSARLDDTPFRVLSEPVARTDGTYVVQVLGDATAEARTLTVVVAVLVGGGLLALLASLVIGSLYARRALVPIRESLRRQREFAADASHELRTPLAVIRASVDHLERHRDEPVADVGEALVDIRAEVDHVAALVDDLLLLARTDSGAVELEHLPLDLADVAEESVASLGPLATERSISLVLDPAPAPVTGDRVRLRQIVTILVDNALRHSPPGATVGVRIRTEPPWASVEVEDEGPGIRPEDLPHLFDRFWRSADAPYQGTGLGLAIAAWIAERHGGTIEASDRQPAGARFRVQLPLRS